MMERSRLTTPVLTLETETKILNLYNLLCVLKPLVPPEASTPIMDVKTFPTSSKELSNFRTEVKSLLKRIENSVDQIELSDVKLVPDSTIENLLSVLKSIESWLGDVKEVRAFGGVTLKLFGNRCTGTTCLQHTPVSNTSPCCSKTSTTKLEKNDRNAAGLYPTTVSHKVTTDVRAIKPGLSTSSTLETGQPLLEATSSIIPKEVSHSSVSLKMCFHCRLFTLESLAEDSDASTVSETKTSSAEPERFTSPKQVLPTSSFQSLTSEVAQEMDDKVHQTETSTQESSTSSSRDGSEATRSEGVTRILYGTAVAVSNTIPAVAQLHTTNVKNSETSQILCGFVRTETNQDLLDQATPTRSGFQLIATPGSSSKPPGREENNPYLDWCGKNDEHRQHSKCGTMEAVGKPSVLEKAFSKLKLRYSTTPTPCTHEFATNSSMQFLPGTGNATTTFKQKTAVKSSTSKESRESSHPGTPTVKQHPPFTKTQGNATTHNPQEVLDVDEHRDYNVLRTTIQPLLPITSVRSASHESSRAPTGSTNMATKAKQLPILKKVHCKITSHNPRVFEHRDSSEVLTTIFQPHLSSKSSISHFELTPTIKEAGVVPSRHVTARDFRSIAATTESALEVQVDSNSAASEPLTLAGRLLDVGSSGATMNRVVVTALPAEIEIGFYPNKDKLVQAPLQSANHEDMLKTQLIAPEQLDVLRIKVMLPKIGPRSRSGLAFVGGSNNGGRDNQTVLLDNIGGTTEIAEELNELRTGTPFDRVISDGEDFEQNSQCLCFIDKMIGDLKSMLYFNYSNSFLNQYECPVILQISPTINLEGGLDITSVVDKKRICRNPDFPNRNKRWDEIMSKINVINTNDIQNSEHEVYANLGMTVRMPCQITSKTKNGAGWSYVWHFEDGLPLTDGKCLEDIKGELMIDNVSTRDDGKYICIASLNTSSESIVHHLHIVSMPTYAISTPMIYIQKNHRCTPNDLQLTFQNFALGIEKLVCGETTTVCEVLVKNATCFSQKARRLAVVNTTITMKPLSDILQNMDTCDVSCQLKVYSKIIRNVLRNVEAVSRLPVVFRSNEMVPASSNLLVDQTEVLVACRPGFGYLRDLHLCGVCGPNTYNPGNVSNCIPCPVGQYQTMAGSKSCLTCKTPLSDRYCLNVVYHSAKQCKAYIGISTAVLITIIILIICFKVIKRRRRKKARLSNLKKRRRRRRTPDIESQDTDTETDSRVFGRNRYKGYKLRHTFDFSDRDTGTEMVPLMNSVHISRERGCARGKPPKPPEPDFD